MYSREFLESRGVRWGGRIIQPLTLYQHRIFNTDRRVTTGGIWKTTYTQTSTNATRKVIQASRAAASARV